jgi:hypothetical protein
VRREGLELLEGLGAAARRADLHTGSFEEIGDELARVRFVVHQEDANSLGPGRARGVGGLRLRRGYAGHAQGRRDERADGQANDERGSVIEAGTVHLDGATV